MLSMNHHPKQAPAPRSHSYHHHNHPGSVAAADIDDILEEMAEQVIIEQQEAAEVAGGASTSSSQMNVTLVGEVPSSAYTPAAVEDRYQLHQRSLSSSRMIDNEFSHLLFQDPLSPPTTMKHSSHSNVDGTDFHKPGSAMMMHLPFNASLAESLLTISPSATTTSSAPPAVVVSSGPNGNSLLERVDEMLDEILEMAENVLEDNHCQKDTKTTRHGVANEEPILIDLDLQDVAHSRMVVTPPVPQARKRSSGTMMDMSTDTIQVSEHMASPFEADTYDNYAAINKRARLAKTLTTSSKDGMDACKQGDKIPFDVFSSTLTSPSYKAAATGSSGIPSTLLKDKWRFRGYQCDIWKERLQELIEYREKYGHCLVPHNWAGNVALAQWVKRQRYQYKLLHEGKHSTMSVERMDILNSMGFVWDSHKVAWEEKFVQLRQYVAEHGHCNVSGKLQVNRPLSIWVKCQRRQRKLMERNEKSTMTVDRIQRLDDLGFDWNPRNL